MSFINTILEWEGAVIDVRPRYWAAHQAAIAAVGFTGPPEEEFWRLLRSDGPDGLLVRFGRAARVAEYSRLRDERRNDTALMALDELQPAARANLPVLKKLGNCHLVTLCPNAAGVNATLDRLDVWMHFDQKRMLPADRERRIQILKELAGGQRTTLVAAGTGPLAYAAGQAGCCVVGLKNGPTFPKLLRQVGVDLFFETLEELTDALSRRDPALQRIGLY